jgi:hypothetical protein
VSYPVTTNAEQLAEAGGTLKNDVNGGTLHLFTADSAPPSPFSVPGDFTEPVYPGYAPVVVPAWAGPFNDVNQLAALSMPGVDFYGPADGGGPTILGCYYLANPGSGSGSGSGSAAGRLVFSALFDNPVPLTNDLYQLIVSAQITVSGSGWVSTQGSVLP